MGICEHSDAKGRILQRLCYPRLSEVGRSNLLCTARSSPSLLQVSVNITQEVFEMALKASDLTSSQRPCTERPESCPPQRHRPGRQHRRHLQPHRPRCSRRRSKRRQYSNLFWRRVLALGRHFCIHAYLRRHHQPHQRRASSHRERPSGIRESYALQSSRSTQRHHQRDEQGLSRARIQRR